MYFVRHECISRINLTRECVRKSRSTHFQSPVCSHRRRTLGVTHSCGRQYAPILGEDITNGPAVDPDQLMLQPRDREAHRLWSDGINDGFTRGLAC